MTEQEWLTSKDPIAMLDWVMQLHFRPSDRKLRLAMCAMSRASAFDSFELMRRVSLAERWADGEIDREAVIASVPGESTSWRDWVVAHHIPRDAAEWASQSYKWVAPFVLREVFGNPFQPVTLPLGEPCRLCRGRGMLLYDRRSREPMIYRQSNLPTYFTMDDLAEAECVSCNGIGHGPPPVLTPLVLQLAEAAYTVRTGTGTLDNDALAVLSDALEDAGLEGAAPCCCDGGYLEGWCGSYRCDVCNGTGVVDKPNPILAHLRDPGPHYRGCWAVDLLLGKE